jgi:flagellar biosynthetic protein FlhB
MAEAQDDDKTEPATPRRLQRAREDGQVAVSRELTTFAGLAAVTLTLMVAGSDTLQSLIQRLSIFLARSHELVPAGPTVYRLAGSAWLNAAAPFVLAALVAGAGAVLLQTRFLLNAKALRVDFARLNPRSGLKRLLGPEALIEAGKSVAKISVLGIVLWRVVLSDLPSLLMAPYGDPHQLLGRAVSPVLHVIMVVLIAQAVIAAIDFLWVSLRHARGLRMSRQDIIDEQKESEGDPRIKARIRQIRMARARRRMLAAVPKATVVITNPTHYAVALVYDRAKHAAPRVVAKGVDTLAARIREVAAENRVPVVANPPLARALYQVELDADIPAEHFQAVAEIIAYVWRLGRPRGTG